MNDSSYSHTRDSHTTIARVGVDVGGTNIRASLFAPDGTCFASAYRSSCHGNEAVIRAICETIRDAQETAITDACQNGHSLPTIAGIGIGIPGTVDSRTGTVQNAVNLGIENCDLGAQISRHFGVPTTVENDVNVAAIGASLLFTHDAGSLAYLNLGTGVAAGFIADGHVMHGFAGLAGEIGHIQIDPAGPVCACGQRGCLEAMISGSALERVWPVEKGWPGIDLFQTASRTGTREQRGERAQKVRDDYCAHLFQAIEIIALSVDPQLIIIGGGVSHIGDPLMEGLNETIRQRENDSAFVRSLHLQTRIVLAPTDVDIARLGAAHCAVPFETHGFSLSSRPGNRPGNHFDARPDDRSGNHLDDLPAASAKTTKAAKEAHPLTV